MAPYNNGAVSNNAQVTLDPARVREVREERVLGVREVPSGSTEGASLYNCVGHRCTTVRDMREKREELVLGRARAVPSGSTEGASLYNCVGGSLYKVNTALLSHRL